MKEARSTKDLSDFGHSEIPSQFVLGHSVFDWPGSGTQSALFPPSNLHVVHNRLPYNGFVLPDGRGDRQQFDARFLSPI
jgi:hypothetical protein